MAVYILRRLGLAVITLLLLSIIVFFAGQVLPGDPGRAILGNLATPGAVRILDHQLGVDRSLLAQYWSWISGLLHGDMGTSYQFRTAVEPFVSASLVNSLKLAALAFIVVVPLGIFGGVVAALNVGRGLDRVISVVGLSATTVPEFVSGIVVIVVFGVELKVLPVTAAAGAGASVLDQVKHLILPAIPLVLILFGYIARMARAGTIEALESDYTRTATLKGLPRSVVIRRHVLRNSLLPTITVIATQTGYLIGGLVVVETLFNYQGIGNLIYKAAQAKDFPMLEAGILTIGVVYMVATLHRGHPVHRAQSAAAPGRRRMTDITAPPSAGVAVTQARPGNSSAPWRLLLRKPTFLAGAIILVFWVICAIFGSSIAPDNPLRAAVAGDQRGALGGALVRHRPDRPGRALPGHRRRPGHPAHQPDRHLARHRARHRPRPGHGLPGRRGGHDRQPGRGGRPGPARGHRGLPVRRRARPLPASPSPSSSALSSRR